MDYLFVSAWAGRSHFPWANAASTPRQTDRLLLPGSAQASCLRIHGEGQLGEASLQKYGRFYNLLYIFY